MLDKKQTNFVKNTDVHLIASQDSLDLQNEAKKIIEKRILRAKATTEVDTESLDLLDSLDKEEKEELKKWQLLMTGNTPNPTKSA